MRISLVARMTLSMVLLVGVAFALLQWNQHRGVERTFIERQLEISAASVHDERSGALVEQIETAYARAGWPAVEGLQIAATAPEFVVLDPNHHVRSSTLEGLTGIKARPEQGGRWQIRSSLTHAGQIQQLDLLLGEGRMLRHNGETFGTLLMLPELPPQQAGTRFADAVGRSTLFGLLIIATVTALLSWLMLKRALSPIDRLTAAVSDLGRVELSSPVPGAADKELDRLIDAYNRAARTLNENAAIRRRLVTDIAHELRTPVTNLGMQIEALSNGMARADPEFVQAMSAQLRLLEGLLEDFQQLALSDTGQLQLNPQRLTVDQLVAETLAPLAHAAGAQLSSDIEQDLWIEVDPERIGQVFANLVDNSRQHRKDGLRLHIEGRGDQGRVRLRLVDNGPGVAAADQPHIFERLYRADKSRARHSGGAGLGLAISRGLLGAMNASIQYDPDNRVGAAFVIEFMPCPPKIV